MRGRSKVRHKRDLGSLEGGGGNGIGKHTKEETFPDFEEVGLCEVAAGC